MGRVLTIEPGRPLQGRVVLPGDKSLSHRALLFAAMADGESVVDHFLASGVTRVMVKALLQMGVPVTVAGDRLTVVGRGWQALQPPAEPLDCGNSATTLRQLAGALAAAGIPAVLDGSPGLRQRPMDRIVGPLLQMGVPIAATGLGQRCAPLVLHARAAGRRLAGVDYTLPVASAQVKTCILLAGLAADGPVVVREPALSRDHTERMFAAMGVHMERLPVPDGVAVRMEPPSGPLQPLRVRLPGDFSSAAFWLVAALVTPGSDVVLEEVGLNPTRTGLLDVLREMGGDIRVMDERMVAGEPAGDIRVVHSALRAVRVHGGRVVRMIDEFPVFAIAAMHAAGRTEVHDARELRYKESDRVAVLCRELNQAGARVEEFEDGFAVEGPCPARACRVQSHGDHRLAMSLAVMGLAAGGAVTVDGAEMVAESYPGFIGVLQALGAAVELREGAPHA
jgi:3-phosphoshikimate 1-carboxyvinyltransferase